MCLEAQLEFPIFLRKISETNYFKGHFGISEFGLCRTKCASSKSDSN